MAPTTVGLLVNVQLVVQHRVNNEEHPSLFPNQLFTLNEVCGWMQYLLAKAHRVPQHHQSRTHLCVCVCVCVQSIHRFKQEVPWKQVFRKCPSLKFHWWNLSRCPVDQWPSIHQASSQTLCLNLFTHLIVQIFRFSSTHRYHVAFFSVHLPPPRHWTFHNSTYFYSQYS